MTALKQAWRKRIKENFLGAGWDFDPGQGDVNAVRCWFYSVGLESGPRMMGQLSAEFFRDIASGGGAIAELARSKLAPQLPYSSFLAKVDATPGLMSDPAERGNLLACMGYYARCTQTWAGLPQLSQVTGLHFWVVDWVTESGVRILRPGAAVQDGPLTCEHLEEAAVIQLAMHLSKSPRETPRGW